MAIRTKRVPRAKPLSNWFIMVGRERFKLIIATPAVRSAAEKRGFSAALKGKFNLYLNRS